MILKNINELINGSPEIIKGTPKQELQLLNNNCLLLNEGNFYVLIRKLNVRPVKSGKVLTRVNSDV
jgi:hypothetical protein